MQQIAVVCQVIFLFCFGTSLLLDAAPISVPVHAALRFSLFFSISHIGFLIVNSINFPSHFAQAARLRYPWHIYTPNPWWGMCSIGLAGSGRRPLCLSLYILMFTLLENSDALFYAECSFCKNKKTQSLVASYCQEAQLHPLRQPLLHSGRPL